MHSFLKAIGFSDITDGKALDKILKLVTDDPDEKRIVALENDRQFAEMSKYFGHECGITVCGEYDENDHFRMEYYHPFFKGSDITTSEDVFMTKHGQRESYAGACDDIRLGITLIFYLQNTGAYLYERMQGLLPTKTAPLTLSGLAQSGTILLPIQKNSSQKEKEQMTIAHRNRLIDAARKGDEEAMETLTMEDMDTYSMISNRLIFEDVMSIVDTYFMPYGVECDQYQVLGEILDFQEYSNTETKEQMLQLNLNCNDIEFDVCINKKDLLGEPEIGRRFKGVIWLQGYLNF